MMIMYVQFELDNKLQNRTVLVSVFYFEILGWDCIEVIGSIIQHSIVISKYA